MPRILPPVWRVSSSQTFRDFRIHVLDNASTDGTIEKLIGFDLDLVRSPTNTGFAKAHNDLIRAYPAEYILILNPDAILKPEFLERWSRRLDLRPDAASATGKLLRLDGKTLDSTGIVMLRSQRHLDRGADEPIAASSINRRMFLVPAGQRLCID